MSGMDEVICKLDASMTMPRMIMTGERIIRCEDCKSFSHGYCKFHNAKFVNQRGYCYWAERDALKDGEQDG